MNILDKVRSFAESRKEIAKKELDKLGYFDENWDRICDLVGEDTILAYRLGIYETMYSLMIELLKILDEDTEVQK